MSIQRLSALPKMQERYYLPPEKLLEGNPMQECTVQYTDSAGKFTAGVWTSEVGKWRVHYTEQEYCEVLEGLCLITDEQGGRFRAAPGDRFVIPSGFIGTWEVLEPCRKYFVIYEP